MSSTRDPLVAQPEVESEWACSKIDQGEELLFARKREKGIVVDCLTIVVEVRPVAVHVVVGVAGGTWLGIGSSAEIVDVAVEEVAVAEDNHLEDLVGSLAGVEGVAEEEVLDTVVAVEEVVVRIAVVVEVEVVVVTVVAAIAVVVGEVAVASSDLDPVHAVVKDPYTLYSEETVL
jgi:hypothetical protein